MYVNILFFGRAFS